MGLHPLIGLRGTLIYDWIINKLFNRDSMVLEMKDVITGVKRLLIQL